MMLLSILMLQLQKRMVEEVTFSAAVSNLAVEIEETALAIAAMADRAPAECLDAGVEWLVNATDNWQRFPAAPIGLYFASLWYDEQLYPVVFSAAALTALASARHQAVEPASLSTP